MGRAIGGFGFSNALAAPVVISIAMALLDASTNAAEPSAAEADQARKDLIVQVAEQISANSGRYMNEKCEQVEIAGWEGFPTSKCIYSKKDSSGARSKKDAMVVLLDAEPHKIATWIVSGCHAARPPEQLRRCSCEVREYIRDMSGGHFPVAGVVYEDMDGDGLHNAWSFRDGVTVSIEGWKQATTAVLAPADIDVALSGKVLHTGSQAGYARVSLTTRAQYTAATPAEKEGLHWLAGVRHAYQAAWASDRNTLIDASIAAGAPAQYIKDCKRNICK